MKKAQSIPFDDGKKGEPSERSAQFDDVLRKMLSTPPQHAQKAPLSQDDKAKKGG